MQWRKWMAALSAVVLIGTTFLPWIEIDSLQLTIKGVDDVQSLNYGPRGRGHIYFAGICLLMILIYRNWSMLLAIVVAFINLAFAASHIYVYREQSPGVGPDKLPGLYLSIAASLALLMFLLYSPVRPSKDK